MIRCVPDTGRVGAGVQDAAYAALGFQYVATFRVEAPDQKPFRREMWSDGRDTSLTCGPSGMTGAETALHTVGADGSIVRTFTVDATDAVTLPRRLGIRRAGLHDEVLIDADASVLHARHLIRVANLLPGAKWPLLTLDEELRLNARTSSLLAKSGMNSGTWVLRLLGGMAAGLVGAALGMCGLPPPSGWIVIGVLVTAASTAGMLLLFTRVWVPGPFPPLASPATWPLPIQLGPALQAALARGPVFRL